MIYRANRAVKVLLGISLLAVIAGAALWVGPALIESRMNPVRTHVASIPNKVEELHRRLLIADLHADTLLWHRNLLEKNTRGHVDVPRLIEGNVALQAFTVVTKAPRGVNLVRNEDTSDLVLPLILAQRWPAATWSSLKQRALYQARQFRQAAAASNGRLVWIRTAADLSAYLVRRRRNAGITAGFLGLEGAQALNGDLRELQSLFDAGFRVMSPTHFTDNAFAGSSTGAAKGGLSPAGRALIKEMEARHMIVDLAHASPRTVDDVLAIAARPVLVSHTGVQATCNSNRNLSDSQIRAVAAKGGLIGVAYFEAATCGTDAAAIVRTIRHVSSLVGVDHVALGSDFDGAVGAPFDTRDLASITEALLAAGFNEGEIAKVMGGNTLQFLEKNLP